MLRLSAGALEPTHPRSISPMAPSSPAPHFRCATRNEIAAPKADNVERRHDITCAQTPVRNERAGRMKAPPRLATRRPCAAPCARQCATASTWPSQPTRASSRASRTSTRPASRRFDKRRADTLSRSSRKPRKMHPTLGTLFGVSSVGRPQEVYRGVAWERPEVRT